MKSNKYYTLKLSLFLFLTEQFLMKSKCWGARYTLNCEVQQDIIFFKYSFFSLYISHDFFVM